MKLLTLYQASSEIAPVVMGKVASLLLAGSTIIGTFSRSLKGGKGAFLSSNELGLSFLLMIHGSLPNLF